MSIKNSKLKITTYNEIGFTLIEALIGVTISSIVGVLLISLLTQNNGLLTQQSAKVSQGTSLNDTETQISELIKSSSSVISSYPVISPQYMTGLTTLVLAIPALDSSGAAVDNVSDYVVITKDPSNSKLLRKMIFPDTNLPSTRKSQNQVLLTRLSLLEFTYLDNANQIVSPTSATKIKYVINQQENTGNGEIVTSANAQINLRNN